MATNATNADIVTQLGLNNEETEAFNRMSRRERRRFNAQPDNNSKLHLFKHSRKEKNLGEKIGHWPKTSWLAVISTWLS
ncbi:673_t:CDS:2 [Paraglomus brasilianum]|uniref:673_t:CDS:1 n=1 Tax=Paraglomus brasilianum TaxID=144538 RepID=A0A9N9DP29_9GLOM|nr:673_t:CDS:2 [Paraglomus brasilianum]